MASMPSSSSDDKSNNNTTPSVRFPRCKTCHFPCLSYAWSNPKTYQHYSTKPCPKAPYTVMCHVCATQPATVHRIDEWMGDKIWKELWLCKACETRTHDWLKTRPLFVLDVVRKLRYDVTVQRPHVEELWF